MTVNLVYTLYWAKGGSEMEHILKIEALTKQYNRHNVIDNVNMSVQTGAIYGLIGRNGAGKTTILKIIGGLAKPSSGKIR